MSGSLEQFPDETGNGRWLTYSELAEIRGIGRESAVKLAHRERWRKLSRNDRDRTIRVFVPAEWLRQAREARPGEEASWINPGIFQEALAALREQLGAAGHRADRAEQIADTERKRADRAETRADQAETRADRAEQVTASEREGRVAAEKRADLAEQAFADERKRAERAEQRRDAERECADGLRDQVQDLVAQLATAGADAKAANDRAWASGEQLASVERRAEAERVRAERAESGAAHERQDFLDAESRTRREQEATRRRADQAEQGKDGERARADALQERLDAMQVQLAARQEVVAAAEAIRQADDRRLALGRWARLRAAWWGSD
jgi:hypothetical protein